VIGTGIDSARRRPRDSGVELSSSTGYDYNGNDSTPRGMTNDQQIMAEERQVPEGSADTERDNSLERGRPIHSGGMKSTMRMSPEYQHQKADKGGVKRDEGGPDDDDRESKGILGKAKDRIMSGVGA
jgi:hypothetical protein